MPVLLSNVSADLSARDVVFEAFTIDQNGTRQARGGVALAILGPGFSTDTKVVVGTPPYPGVEVVVSFGGDLGGDGP